MQQLQLQPERYSMYVPGEYKQYCAEMAKSSTWGDHVTLQAAAGVQLVGRLTTQGFLDDKSNLALLVGTVRMITIMCVLSSKKWRTNNWYPCAHMVPCPYLCADVFGLRINVLTSFKEECVIKIEPAKASSSRVLWLSFWAEVSNTQWDFCCGWFW